MYLPTSLVALCLSYAVVTRAAADGNSSTAVDYVEVCKQISNTISSASGVFYLSDKNFDVDVAAWSSTNIQIAACVVEPGKAEDVAATIKILGDMNAKFAIKSGGHSPNPGFSSTTGVLISMTRFSNVEYNSNTKTATIGSGLVWDSVYEALEPHGVSVLGARASGIGVGGFLLGGGYSFKTNQYGLAMDTVVAYSLVKPDGQILTVTDKSDPELFFGLKGGLNNFGIVTKFSMKTFPQTKVWGGSIIYAATEIPAVKQAIGNFIANVKDTKASMFSSFAYSQNVSVVFQAVFYDAPSPPQGIFDEFLKISSVQKDISERSLLQLVRAIPSNTTSGLRNAFATVPVYKYTSAMLDAIATETETQGKALTGKSAVLVSNSVEYFTSDFLSLSTVQTAYPPNRTHVFSPMFINYAWALGGFDQDFNAVLSKSQAVLEAVALKGAGKLIARDASLYPNYAPSGTPLDQMYGQNLQWLVALKKKVDPENVMGLAGGFKL